MATEFFTEASPAALEERRSRSYPPPGDVGNEFAGKVALITGASRPNGIGAATGLELAKRGLESLTITSTPTSEGQAKETAQMIADRGTNVLWLAADHRLVAETERVVRETMDKFGRLNLVVGAAGTRRDSLALRMREETWDYVLDLILKGNFFLGQAAMRLSKGTLESIVYVGSIAGKYGNLGQAHYGAAKAGLDIVAKSQADEWGSRSVRVNVIHPGFVATEMTSDLLNNPKAQRVISERFALGRMGRAEEIAYAIAHYLSPQSSFATGGNFKIDGGFNPFGVGKGGD